VAATALVLIGLAVYYREPRSQRPELPPPVPLTSFPGREEMASFSPNGSQVAFSWEGQSQDNFDIYVKLIDSPAALRLTEHPAGTRPGLVAEWNQIASCGSVRGRRRSPSDDANRWAERLPGNLANRQVRSGRSWSPTANGFCC
jgi:hypothetical protein